MHTYKNSYSDPKLIVYGCQLLPTEIHTESVIVGTLSENSVN